MEGIFNFWFWSKGHLLNPLSAPMGADNKLKVHTPGLHGPIKTARTSPCTRPAPIPLQSGLG